MSDKAKVLRPFIVSDVSLVSSTVSATDSRASGTYNAGTTYPLGEVIQVDSPTFTFTASGSTLTATAHGWANGDLVKVSSSGTLPGGLTASTAYYIVNKTTNAIKLATIKNGAPIITTSAGTGTHTVTVSSHKVYESLQAANLANTPHKSPTWWLDLGSTNRWKAFDSSISSQSENADSMQYVIQAKGRIDGVALMNVSGGEVVISARIAGMAVGATTNATGYAIGLSTVTLASAGTGAVAVGDIVTFAGQTTQYTVTSGDADVSGGGSITFTPALVASIPASATALTVTVYGPNTYSLISSIEVSSYWAWFYEPIVRKNNFVDIDFPAYSNLELTITLNDTGNTVRCGAMVVGLSKTLGDPLYGASLGLTDYSVKSTDAFGNTQITERAFSKRISITIMIDVVATDGIQKMLEQYRAIPIVYVGTKYHEGAIIYGYYRDFSIVLSDTNYSTCNLELESLT